MSSNVLMLLANGFRPDPRVLKEARSLVEHGFAVTILCLDRHQDLAPEEDHAGIRLLRFRVGRVRPGSAASLAVALPRFYLQAARAARALHAERPIDLVHCHDFDTVLLGLHLRRRLRAPVVYDLHDLYSAFLPDGLPARAIQKIDQWVWRTVDGMVTTNDRYASLTFVEGARAELVFNAPPRAGGRISRETGVGLLYAGNLDPTRDMRYALPVFEESGLQAFIAGDGPLLDAYRAADRGNVTFPGRIPHHEVEEKTRDCLAVMALYDTAFRVNRLGAPNKLFDAMKWGKPAIVSAGSVAGEIVEQRRCGIAVRYGDPESLRSALAELRDPDRYDRMSRNAHQAFLEVYNWETMMPRLLSLYEDLLAASGNR